MPRPGSSARPARRSPCPIAGALDLLGDRWTLLVVRDLFAGQTRYAEFAGSMEKIPTNLLADRLKRLEDAGLVTSVPYQHNPPRYRYSLTPKGESLRPVLQEIVIHKQAVIFGIERVAQSLVARTRQYLQHHQVSLIGWSVRGNLDYKIAVINNGPIQ
jgi:DNA-binding HxlR family transcriptional regulator